MLEKPIRTQADQVIIDNGYMFSDGYQDQFK